MSNQTSLEYRYAVLHMQRALRPFKRSKAFLVAVALPEDADEDKWKDAAKRVLSDIVKAVEIDDDEYRDFRRATRGANSVDFFEVSSKGKRVVHRLDPMTGLVFGDVRTVGLVRRSEFEELMSYPSISIVDAVVDIEAVDPAIVQRAAKNIFSVEITRQDAEDIIALPMKLRESIRRTGRSLESVLARLRAAGAKGQPAKTTPKKSEGVPRLEDLHGYGGAKLWGLDLARDLEDYRVGRISWDDVDSGLLLSGPPGTGKTTFAKALANTLDAHFVAGSYALWQSAGHQGDMLRAMRKAFEEAINNAPSVLLIDEVDNFLQRGSIGDGRSDEYMRGVVNGLLEQMDGAAGRDGVIVIGACNNASNVDEALRRPGRLDRHVEISLPDAEARSKILRYHLQADLDIATIMHRTEGFSGADLERIARDARRLARREAVAVSAQHVMDSMPVFRKMPLDEIRASAVHELGHAIVGIVLGHRQLKRVVVHKEVPDGAKVAAFAAFDNCTIYRRDSRFLRDEVCVYLASLAVEQMVYGDHCDGVALDLEQATETATHMVASAGMGKTLSSDSAFSPSMAAASRMRNQTVARAVEEVLQQELARAREIVERYRDVIERLADALEDAGTLNGDVIKAAVREHANPVQLALAV